MVAIGGLDSGEARQLCLESDTVEFQNVEANVESICRYLGSKCTSRQTYPDFTFCNHHSLSASPRSYDPGIAFFSSRNQ